MKIFGNLKKRNLQSPAPRARCSYQIKRSSQDWYKKKRATNISFHANAINPSSSIPRRNPNSSHHRSPNSKQPCTTNSPVSVGGPFIPAPLSSPRFEYHRASPSEESIAGRIERCRGELSRWGGIARETLRIYQKPKRSAMSYRCCNAKSYVEIIFMSTSESGPPRDISPKNCSTNKCSARQRATIQMEHHCCSCFQFCFLSLLFYTTRLISVPSMVKRSPRDEHAIEPRVPAINAGYLHEKLWDEVIFAGRLLPTMQLAAPPWR